MKYTFWCDNHSDVVREFKNDTASEYIEDSFFEWLEELDYTLDEIDVMIGIGEAGYYADV